MSLARPDGQHDRLTDELRRVQGDRPGSGQDAPGPQVLVELGSGHRRIDDRDRDPGIGQLDPGDLGEHVEGGFGGGVAAQPRKHPQRRGRTHVHDGPAASAPHGWKHRLHTPQGCDDVELEHSPQVDRVQLLERYVEALSGVVHQDVHTAEPVDRLRHQVLELAVDGDIGGDGHRTR